MRYAAFLLLVPATFTPVASAQPMVPAAPKLDAKLVDAWKRAGAQVGWYAVPVQVIWQEDEKKQPVDIHA